MKRSRTKRTSYNPTSQRNRDILDRAFEHIQSVPYKVSLRWVFYRLLQDGLYTKKSQYKSHWTDISSNARRGHYKDWRPDTLIDDTRWSDIQGWGYDSTDDWLENLKPKCYLDRYKDQDYYIECWFEARAMYDQFKYYTRHLTLAAMGGDGSIHFRWELAKRLEMAYERYHLPIAILYFGDYDTKGQTIFESTRMDISNWCKYPVTLIWCGLTLDQAITYNIPQEEEGKYQWEALSDESAQEIITSWVNKYHRQGGDLKEQEQEVERFVGDKLDAAIKEWTNSSKAR